MAKKLNEEAIQNELKEGSAFFKPVEKEKMEKAPNDGAEIDTMLLSNQDTAPENDQPDLETDLIETVRSAVRVIGKEAATHRFTRKEKQELKRLIYTYSTKGLQTNETQITRIAVNLLLEEHRVDPGNSKLERILKLLSE